ncbi:HPr family phosphocarrier protein [Uniformispora flossi]|uniref:HPr family phosphocarrier protein n=1 Tax=Uniformispora flossi TaxID=3390723 RepID=UPI003C2BDE38
MSASSEAGDAGAEAPAEADSDAPAHVETEAGAGAGAGTRVPESAGGRPAARDGESAEAAVDARVRGRARGGADESAEAVVVLGADLHARPAAALVRAAAGYRAEVVVAAPDGRIVHAASVLELLGLAARAGTTLTVRGQGPDASAAVGAVAGLLGAGGERAG